MRGAFKRWSVLGPGALLDLPTFDLIEFVLLHLQFVLLRLARSSDLDSSAIVCVTWYVIGAARLNTISLFVCVSWCGRRNLNRRFGVVCARTKGRSQLEPGRNVEPNYGFVTFATLKAQNTVTHPRHGDYECPPRVTLRSRFARRSVEECRVRLIIRGFCDSSCKCAINRS